MAELISLLFGPQWFYKESLGIDLISAAILVACALASMKYSAHTSKKRQHKKLTFAFVLIAVAFVIKAIVGVLAHYQLVQPESPLVALFGTILGVGGTVMLIVFLLYHALTLFGFYLFYTIYHKQTTRNMILGIYLLGIVVFVAIGANFVFHLTLALLIGFVTSTYYERYRKTNNPVTRTLMIGFGIIALSHAVFVFKYFVVLYLIAELFQLIGYITLLAALVMVLRHGKKTIANRHHT